jgi:hypothetical protein
LSTQKGASLARRHIHPYKGGMCVCVCYLNCVAVATHISSSSSWFVPRHTRRSWAMSGQVDGSATGNPLLRALSVARSIDGEYVEISHFNGGHVPGTLSATVQSPRVPNWRDRPVDRTTQHINRTPISPPLIHTKSRIGPCFAAPALASICRQPPGV